MANILNGKDVVNAMMQQVMNLVGDLKKKEIIPKLGIIRVGNKPDDLYYEAGAKKTCESAGVACEVFSYSDNVTQEVLEQALTEINNRGDINGILMFCPLPQNLDESRIRELISPVKDVDGLTMGSFAKIYAGNETGFPPCTAQAVMEMLNHYGIPFLGQRVVVVGRSLVVGKPLSMLLLHKNATVTICHSKTKNLSQVCREADILIVAVGRAKLVKSNFVKTGQIVIDVGINKDPDNAQRYCGDVDFEEVEPMVAHITPVPGGVGSVTTAVLCKHTVLACMRQNEL